MILSAETRRQIEIFFRDYFADENIELSEIRIYGRRGAKILTALLAVEGIVFGRHIFIAPRSLRRDSEGRLRASSELIVHEVAHALQYRREGFFGFFYNYLSAYFAVLRREKKRDAAARFKAYKEIPHEIEARRASAKYVVWRDECRLTIAARTVNPRR